ncbi:hypothetical protein ACFL6K_06020 [Candidatus Latescibacterota bacterium]
MKTFSWILQIFGVVVMIGTLINAPSMGRLSGIFLMLGGVFIAIGRQAYLPKVNLFKTCRFCKKEIRISNTICPYCKQKQRVQHTSGFPEDWKPRYHK